MHTHTVLHIHSRAIPLLIYITFIHAISFITLDSSFSCFFSNSVLFDRKIKRLLLYSAGSHWKEFPSAPRGYILLQKWARKFFWHATRYNSEVHSVFLGAIICESGVLRIRSLYPSVNAGRLQDIILMIENITIDLYLPSLMLWHIIYVYSSNTSQKMWPYFDVRVCALGCCTNEYALDRYIFVDIIIFILIDHGDIFNSYQSLFIDTNYQSIYLPITNNIY